MAAWGQTSAHLLHWMQRSSSHTGMSMAMLRFSHWVVAVGQVPSGGKADTGSRSPLLASISAVTFLTRSGASSETMGGRSVVAVTAAGIVSWWRLARVESTAR
jgi:hypothetical protein